MIEIRADRRRENLSTADEVVVIILYEVEITLYWDIVFAEQAEDSTLQMFFNIYVHHTAYISFAYLLIFLFDDYRYHWGFKLGDIHC